MTEEIIEQIYASSFVPELWQKALGDLATIAGARAGMLFVINGNIRRGTASTEAGREAIVGLIQTGYIDRIRRIKTLSALRYAGFKRDTDMFTLEEISADPFYREILYPRGLGWAAGTNFDLSTGDRYIFSVERDHVRGPVEEAAIHQLDALRPHLGRAAMISARLQLERARTASDTLALIGLPTLVLDPKGKVVSANNLVDDLAKDYISWRAFDFVTFKDQVAERLLRDALTALNGGFHSAVRSFPIRDADGVARMIAHLVPIRMDACDIFVNCSAVLVMMPISRASAPPVDLIQSLFDLTPAEARVAQKLAIGRSIDDIASDTGVSRNTVRTQMHNVLEKTGCARQAEAAALLGKVSAFLPEASP
jgi:DNA-binding CsgD family transcriptional regulator